MTLLQLLLLLAIALSGWPVGRLIASKTAEELAAGRKWFRLIATACIIAIALSAAFLRENDLLLSVVSFTFILLLALAGLKKKSKRK